MEKKDEATNSDSVVLQAGLELGMGQILLQRPRKELRGSY